MHPTTQRPADLHDWLVAHDPMPVTALIDATVEQDGFDVRSTYVETYWLALLGPSCVLAARRLVAWLAAQPAGYEISLVALAGTLGLGSGTGRNAPVMRTLGRLVDFHIATVGDTYAIRRSLPLLSAPQVARLPEHLAVAHAVDRTAAVMRQ